MKKIVLVLSGILLVFLFYTFVIKDKEEEQKYKSFIEKPFGEPSNYQESSFEKTKNRIQTLEDIEQYKEPNGGEKDYRYERIINDEGSVTVAASFLNPYEEIGEYWVFEVLFDTHSIDLDQYNYEELITITIDDEVRIKEDMSIQVEGAGHHLALTLSFPKFIDGREIINDQVDNLTIQVQDVGDVPMRKFTWRVEG